MPTYRMKKKVGPHLFKEEWLHPGDTITCEVDEIEQVMEKFEEVRKAKPKDEPPEETEVDPEPEVENSLEMVHKGRGKYDVVNPDSGKTINDKPLSKEEATSLLRHKK